MGEVSRGKKFPVFSILDGSTYLSACKIVMTAKPGEATGNFLYWKLLLLETTSPWKLVLPSPAQPDSQPCGKVEPVGRIAEHFLIIPIEQVFDAGEEAEVIGQPQSAREIDAGIAFVVNRISAGIEA